MIVLNIIVFSFVTVMVFYFIKLNVKNEHTVQVCSKCEEKSYEIKKSREKYIQLMKKIILNSIYEDGPWIIDGNSWPTGKALTMIGTRRMDNIYLLLKKIIEKNVKGDVIEAGCWRGGAMMFARAILDTYEQNSRKVYLCDSFQGIPPSKNSQYSQDKGAHTLTILNNNPVENVYKMLKKLDLESGTIVVKGYFNETLDKIPSKLFSLIRLDGDTYISTMQAITSLYPRLSIGGYIIIDDYLDWISCKDAITDYRKQHNINEEIIEVYHEKGEIKRGVYWEKKKNI